MEVRHLLKARGRDPTLHRTACGIRGPRHYSTNPRLVTCLACQRTLFMADAEFRLSQSRKQ